LKAFPGAISLEKVNKSDKFILSSYE
jgi:hypothetical protein